MTPLQRRLRASSLRQQRSVVLGSTSRKKKMRLPSLTLLVLLAACSTAEKAPDSTATTDTAATTPTPALAAPANAVVTEHGIPPLTVGMAIAEASAALKTGLVAPPGADTSACTYLQWSDAPEGVRVMTSGGRIARIDVNSGSTATAAGARVGDTEQRIDSLYKGRVASSPHKYTKGHYLTVTPVAPADSGYRIVFETDGQRVTKYRAGRRPEVELVEGCG